MSMEGQGDHLGSGYGCSRVKMADRSVWVRYEKMINPERGMFGLCSDQTLSSIDANQKPETRNQALRSLMILQLFKSLYSSKIIIKS